MPQTGVLEAKSEIHIKFKFVVKLFGKFSFFFRCNCDALDLPIGFELTGDVFGLDIAYEIVPKECAQDMLKKVFMRRRSSNFGPIALDLPAMTSQKSLEANGNNTVSSLKTSMGTRGRQTAKDLALKQLEFLSLNINEPGAGKFVIKNLSGIPTYFRLRFEEYESPYQPINQMEKSFNGSEIQNKSLTKNFTVTSDFSKTKKTGNT